uniref:Mucin-like 1 n=1 Tax=Sus scrofa TaxID=9823 RepID=A0A0E4FHF9_PIG|nr:mucin-like 1 [Sus scrofa]
MKLLVALALVAVSSFLVSGHKPAATALFGPLAWEPYAMGFLLIAAPEDTTIADDTTANSGKTNPSTSSRRGAVVNESD